MLKLVPGVFMMSSKRLAEEACDCDSEVGITGNSAVLNQSSHTHIHKHFLIHRLAHTYTENQYMCGSGQAETGRKAD